MISYTEKKYKECSVIKCGKITMVELTGVEPATS
jgi:hypothetical protein